MGVRIVLIYLNFHNILLLVSLGSKDLHCLWISTLQTKDRESEIKSFARSSLFLKESSVHIALDPQGMKYVMNNVLVMVAFTPLLISCGSLVYMFDLHSFLCTNFLYTQHLEALSLNFLKYGRGSCFPCCQQMLDLELCINQTERKWIAVEFNLQFFFAASHCLKKDIPFIGSFVEESWNSNVKLDNKTSALTMHPVCIV